MTNSISRTRAARSRRRILSVLLLSLLSSIAYGQTPQTATITVIVQGFAGSPVPNATVIATRKDTKQSIQQVTNEDGVAIFVGLANGIYDVTVESPGFNIMRWQGVEISSVKQSATLKFKLPVGNTGKLVLLTAEGVRVESEEERGDALSALPNLNNDLTPLLQIVPGAVAAGSSSLGRVIIDGKGNEQRTARLDGVDFISQIDFPSADAAINPVGSFEKPEVAGDLDSSKTRSGAFGFTSISGPGTGSVSESVTYRGTDAGWKLQLYGDHRNDVFNARNFFDYDGKNAVRRTRFGGKFGQSFGKANRLSFLLAYDGWRGRTERNVYEAVPADALTVGATGPLAPYMRGFLPPGTHLMPGASLNPDFVVAGRRTRTTIDSNAWNLRLDYFPFRPLPTASAAITEAPKALSAFTLRLTHQTAENSVPDGVTGRSQRQRFVFANGLIGLKLITHKKAIPSEQEPKPKPKQFGHNLRFGFNLTRAHMDAEINSSTSSDLAQSLITTGGTVRVTGLPLSPAPPDQLLTVPVATLGGIIKGTGRGLDLKPISYSAIYDFSRPIKENHELFAGFEARFIHLDFDRLGGLTYSFPNVAALRSGTPGSVTFQSDLSGPSPFSEGTGRRRASQQFYMAYFQMVSQFLVPGNPDLEPALTLTYGLRYDRFGQVRERDNRAVVINPLNGQMLPAGTPFYHVDNINLQPRFGLAYRFANVGTFKNTVLRAGVGLYSGVPRISDLMLPIESDRFSTGINGGTFPALPSNVISGFVNNPLTRQFQPLAFARDFSPLERALKWDVKLGHTYNGYEFSAYYAGNVGRNLSLANIANRIISVATNPDPTKAAIVVREFDVVRGGLVFQPFGEFFYRRGGGRSSYRALTFQVSRDTNDVRPTPRWLKLPVASFNAKYTLSRSVGNASGTIMSNPFDPDADFGYNSGVARHSFTLSAVYDLWNSAETTTGKPNDLLRGWKIMPSLKVSSGLPLIIRLNRPDVVYVDASGSVFASPAAGRTAIINTPGGASSSGAFFVPNLVAGVNPYLGGFADRLLLDPAAFAIPAPGQFGNLRRGQLRGRGAIQLDLGIRRNLPLDKLLSKEKVRGEFQIDIFNIFNRTNFNNPTAVLPGSLGTNAAENQLQPGVPFSRAAAGTFGFINAADPGRLIQFSFTLKFHEGFTK